MRVNFANGGWAGKKSMSDVEGFKRARRYIILSEINSSTIPNILDLFFGLMVGGTNYVPETTKKTRAIVINQSEVYGTYYGLRDARSRNVFIHHGYIDAPVNNVQGEHVVMFTDVDWNVIEDCPESIEIGRKNGRRYDALGEVMVSYDEAQRDFIVRKESGNEILIPPPLYYDEKDMVLVGGMDGFSYGNHIADLKESAFIMSEDKYINKMYKVTLNDLIDVNTQIVKMNITVDNLSTKITLQDQSFSEMIHEVSALTKYALEKYGFSGCEVIFSGSKGYNLKNIKSALNLSDIETRVNFICICGELKELNENVLKEDLDAYDCSIIMTFSYTNVKVTVIDREPEVGINSTDSNVLSLSTALKYREGAY